MGMFLDTSSIITNTLSYDMVRSVTPITNIVAKNGKFKMIKTPLMVSVIEDKNLFEDLPEVRPFIHLNIPKIPFHVFELIGSFFKKVYVKDKTEASIMVFYNKADDDFIVWAPIQSNGGASSNYKRDDDPNYVRMCTDNMLVMVAHSHPWAATKGPSPSGIDATDEKESLLYMILGNVEKMPTYTLSTCPNAHRTYMEFQEVFEVPKIELTREEKIKILTDKKKITLSPVNKVFFKFSTEEEFDNFFEDNIDEDIIDVMVALAYEECLDEVPPEWMAQCIHTPPTSYVYRGPTNRPYAGYDDVDFWDGFSKEKKYLPEEKRIYEATGETLNDDYTAKDVALYEEYIAEARIEDARKAMLADPYEGQI